MSPASSGALEVERYIGACLFSSQLRTKGAFSKPLFHEHLYASHYTQPLNSNHHVQQCRTADGWAGGLPLISFANNNQRRNNARALELQHVARNPLSRLAVHTQGAPLILSNRYNNRKNNKSKGTSKNNANTDKLKELNSHNDSISVNSDESSNSGSANSENVLPRIIKPRKRRKKDRKPLHIVRPIESDDCFSTDCGSPDSVDLTPSLSVNHYIPFNFEPYSYSVLHKTVNDLLETPKLHHSFDEVQEFSKDIIEMQASSCQCRYCDPAGLIWDVDRHCYSPYLTTPGVNKNSFTLPELGVNALTSELDVNSLTKGYEASLPTNFLECMQSLSLEDNSIKKYPASGFSRDLEVSTEIVTSLNGHRDLEIKFFSTPTVCDNSEKEFVDYRSQELITKPVICK